MSIITQIIQELDERAMAVNVGRKYDDARISFQLTSNRVSSEDEFYQILGSFYNHMYSRCVTPGASLAPHEAVERAVKTIEDYLREDGGNIRTAYQNAVDGINGGMFRLLDTTAGGLRTEAQHLYTEHVLRTYISPMDWDAKVDAIRSLLNHYKHDLPSDIDVAHPEKYAHDYSALIKGLVHRVNKTARDLRRY